VPVNGHAGQVLTGFTGTIVRDGYAGYSHLIDAHHAWCGAHLLCDLRGLHTADSCGQTWATAMATTLAEANTAAATARAAGQTVLIPTRWPQSATTTAASQH
jgi:transposase